MQYQRGMRKSCSLLLLLCIIGIQIINAANARNADSDPVGKSTVEKNKWMPTVFVSSYLTEAQLKIAGTRLAIVKSGNDFAHSLGAYVWGHFNSKPSNEACKNVQGRLFRNAFIEDVYFAFHALNLLKCDFGDEPRIPPSIPRALLQGIDEDLSTSISSVASTLDPSQSYQLPKIPPWIAIAPRIELLDATASTDSEWVNKRAKLFELIEDFVDTEIQKPAPDHSVLFIELFDVLLQQKIKNLTSLPSAEDWAIKLIQRWSKWIEVSTLPTMNSIESWNTYLTQMRLQSIHTFNTKMQSLFTIKGVTFTGQRLLSRYLSDLTSTAIANLRNLVDNSSVSVSKHSRSLCYSYLFLRPLPLFHSNAVSLSVSVVSCSDGSKFCSNVDVCPTLPLSEEYPELKEWLQSTSLSSMESTTPFTASIMNKVSTEPLTSSVCDGGYHSQYVIDRPKLGGFLLQWKSPAADQQLFIPSGFLQSTNSMFASDGALEYIRIDGEQDYDLVESETPKKITVRAAIADRVAQSILDSSKSKLTFGVPTSLSSDGVHVSVLFEVHQSKPVTGVSLIPRASTAADALLNHPYGAPTSHIQDLQPLSPTSPVFETVIDIPTLVRTLYLTPKSAVNVVGLLSRGNGHKSNRISAGNQLTFKSTPIQDFNSTNVVVVKTRDGQFYSVTKREAFWHHPPLITHQFPVPASRPAFIVSGVGLVACVTVPLVVFMVGVRQLKLVLLPMTFLHLIFMMCLIFGAVLLFVYWIHLNFIQFLAILFPFLPVAAFIGRYLLIQVRGRSLGLVLDESEKRLKKD